MIAAFVAGLAIFLLSVTVHLVVLRLIGGRSFLVVAMLQALVLSILGGVRLAPAGAAHALFAIFVYLTLWNLYLVVLINVQNSVTLRMLREVAVAPGGALSPAQLEAAFPDEVAFESRLRAMARNRLIDLAPDGTARLRPPGRAIGALVQAVRSLFGIVNFG